MNMGKNYTERFPSEFATQPSDVRGMAPQERDGLIVSLVQVDGTWQLLSRYGEDKWLFSGGATNLQSTQRTLDFSRVPAPFRATMKSILYRYLRRGRAGKKRPGLLSMRMLFFDALWFLRHLVKLKLKCLRAATPMVCSLCVHELKAERYGKKRKPLSSVTIHHRLIAVEALHELSQYTDDPMRAKPWPDTSAAIIAGLAGDGCTRMKRGSMTPLMPDTVFSALFQAAWAEVSRCDLPLRLREELAEIKVKHQRQRGCYFNHVNRHLAVRGWIGGLAGLNVALNDLRTACYIVVASLSGCRNHELAYVQTGACYSTKDDDGDVYWWMRSRSTKTDEGQTEWMIPAAAVTALKAMDRWAKPYQAMIVEEITRRRAANPADPEIAEAHKHLCAVFLGVTSKMHNRVRTLTTTGWHPALLAFAKKHGIDWHLTTHQFRRKFANYAARSQFGDLRYLKEHFKHWSMDMTLGYALNESQEVALYAEIRDELDDLKDGVIENWLEPNEPLAGGLGKNVMAWRGEHAVTMFKNKRHMVRSLSDSIAIRSSGHGWCTADDNLCIGSGGLDRTRCAQCNNAVIGRMHAHIYQGLYDQLKAVITCDDIGEGGLARVRRDIDRCRDVLVSLGYDPEGQTT